MDIELITPYSMTTDRVLSRFEYGDTEQDDLFSGSGIRVIQVDVCACATETHEGLVRDLWACYNSTDQDAWVKYQVITPASSAQFATGPFWCNLREFGLRDAKKIIHECEYAGFERGFNRALFRDAHQENMLRRKSQP